jgi:hypothetical protein
VNVVVPAVTVDGPTTGSGDATPGAEAGPDTEAGADGTPDAGIEGTPEPVGRTEGDIEPELAGKPGGVADPTPDMDPDAELGAVTEPGAPPEPGGDKGIPEGTVPAVTVVTNDGSVTVTTEAGPDADPETVLEPVTDADTPGMVAPAVTVVMEPSDGAPDRMLPAPNGTLGAAAELEPTMDPRPDSD